MDASRLRSINASISPILQQSQLRLPLASLLHFPVARSARTVLWQRNAEQISEVYLDSGVSHALAERYGGRGVGTNGGGVRCGIVNGIQLKGVGPNPLRGKNRDFFHSYGGASLNECMYEAIWSETLAPALPHGTTRSLSIAMTGERVPLLAPKPKQEPTTPGAILCREPCLRPAHYMRAVDFDPIEDFSMYPSDVERTRAAIKTLPATLAEVFFDEFSTTGSLPSDPFELIVPIFTRAAEQIAAARAKRVMHGSLIDSNFSIDGRWLDFSTTSSVPDYAPLLISPGAPDFMQEERLLFQTIGDLVIYLEKYGDVRRGQPQERSAVIAKSVTNRFNERLPMEFAKLTGIPGRLLSQIDRALIDRLFEAQRCLIALKRYEPTSILGLKDHEAIECLQSLQEGEGTRLNEAMRVLALASDETFAANTLKEVVTDNQVRERLIATYFELRRAALASIDKDAVTNRYFAINAIRVNAPVAGFYRPVLYGEIERAIIDGEDIGAFVDDKIAAGRTLFAEPDDRSAIDLSDWFNENARLHPDGSVELQSERVDEARWRLIVRNPHIKSHLMSLQNLNEVV